MATIDSLDPKPTPLTTDTIELNDGLKATLGSLPVSTAQAADATGKVSAHNDDTGAHGQTAVGRAVVTAVDAAAGRAAIGAASQSDLDTKAPLASPVFTGTVTATSFKGGTVLAADGTTALSLGNDRSAVTPSGLVAIEWSELDPSTPVVLLPEDTFIGSVTSTEISHLSGVTSAIQTQLNGKLAPNGDGSALTGLTKSQVGLGNVDNTSDADKPVSTAQGSADLQVALSRQQGPYFYSDGVTANRRIEHIMGDHGNIAATAATLLLDIPLVPTANPSATAYLHHTASSATSPNVADSQRVELTTAGALRIIAVGATTGDTRILTYAGFRAAYSGRAARLSITYAADSATAPAITANGLDITASFAETTAGTAPNWQAAALNCTYHIAALNWPAGPAPVATIINAALTSAEALAWSTGGHHPAWVDFGGSQQGLVAPDRNGTFTATATDWGGGGTGASATLDAANDRLDCAITGGSQSISLTAKDYIIAARPGARWSVEIDIENWSGDCNLSFRTGPNANVIGGPTINGNGTYSAEITFPANASGLYLRVGAFTSATTFNITGFRVRPLGLLSDPLPNPAPILATRDAGPNGQSALLLGMTGLGTPDGRFAYTARNTASGNTQLLGGQVQATAGVRYDSIRVRPRTGTPTIYLGTSSGGSQIVASVALTAGVWQDLTLVARRNTTGNLWINVSTTDVVDVMVEGSIETPAAY